MSKTSTQQPQQTTNTYSLNGQTKAQVTKGENGTSSSYWMNPWEKEAFDFAQNSFAENLPNINVFSPETLQSLNSQVEAYKLQGIKNLNDIYKPMIKNLQNDVATRFGNLNNSVFMDKLGALESKRADSAGALAQNIAAKAQELINSELANRYNYLNFLNNYQNQMLGNARNAVGMGSLNSGAINNQGASRNMFDGVNTNAIMEILPYIMAAM